jgi:hypothetical protein
VPARPCNKGLFQQGMIATVGDHGGISGREEIALNHEVHETLEYYTGRLRATDVRQVGPQIACSNSQDTL